MRPIEFRGKSTAYNKWVYGDLVHYADPERIYIKDAKRVLILIDPDTVGQWTTKLDKNKKYIYEGDIVRVEYAEDIDQPPFIDYIVRWDDKKCGFVVEDFEETCDFEDVLGADQLCNYASVIGNRFDTPELLGGGA